MYSLYRKKLIDSINSVAPKILYSLPMLIIGFLDHSHIFKLMAIYTPPNAIYTYNFNDIGTFI